MTEDFGSSDWECREFTGELDPDTECVRCWGSGEVPTESHESYLGQQYKACPQCGGTGGR
jgi:DnaJ-class molecular chaperone